jgi:hypothetical protein
VVHFFNKTGIYKPSNLFLYYKLLVLGETSVSLLDKLGMWVQMGLTSLGTPSMSASFHAKMPLISWRNLMSVSSYLGSKVLPM